MRKTIMILLLLLFPVLVVGGEYKFLATDGDYDFEADSRKTGHQMSATFAGGNPTGGTLTVSAKAPGSTGFIEVSVFNSVSVTSPIAIMFSGSVSEFRFTTASITNSTGVTVIDTDRDYIMGSFYGTE